MNGDTSTYNDFYQSLVGDVGNSAENSKRNFDHQTAVTTQLENYRETISGVSLDEEMIKMMEYQHAFTAASKLVSVTDEMLNTIIGLR